MLIPPQPRPGAVAPRLPPEARFFRYRLRGFILLLRVLLLCWHAGAHADRPLPNPPAQPTLPNFLEATAVDYAHSQLFNTVEGIAPVREPRSARPEPSPGPAPSSPAAGAPMLAPPSGNLRRVNAP
ncbi:hypothetical protein QTN24_06350 [Cupriavidus sp. SZY C1]|uniref:hypothetical protein n=1 Tax=Cupriavidus sp. SZY C1 TaxID=3055037 RepID=UPI0028B58075|nr:hypothetical protein [Cupriavidus sp. SZY C1]MDT6961109.1 hypothetical protein [Cupriavidus sp. SZY C1]